ncbi:DUF349 domain-containing protein [Microbacterium pumilum]|uniref:DUF349 domain-containing protein n=1 Tax=Microbacterium pumilum TaxID=344165 RepID=A0ABN2SLY2_9MICO
MTAAADLTPESTVDEPAEAETAVDPTAPAADRVEVVEAASSDDTETVGAEADDQPADLIESDAGEPTVAPVDAEVPTAEEPLEADPVEEDSPVEESVAEEPAAEEPAAEEPVAEEPATEDSVADESAPAQPAVPGPVVPGPTLPRPAPRPVAPQAAAAPAAPSSSGEPWGRVDDDGTVSVREGDSWRVVGQYPDGSSEEALAYYERKYADLASEVGLLEVRHHRGGASAADLRSAARAVNAKLDGAAAVGDLASLVARVAALTESLTAASETEAAAAREAVDEAVRTRTQLVEKVEAIAARDPRTVQWKQASADVSALFDQWQSDQQNGPRLPKSVAQQLWKRFRDARATFDKHRREFYAELDEAHKGVRDRKTRLVEKAEALAPKGEDGIPAYRELLDEWKTAGRAGKKVDDALWARFKAAGDALYSARIERESADAEASREKIEAKRALIEEARSVADERNIVKARTTLTGIQRRWDEIGRIFPRESERALDDDLRKIEQSLRTREEADWKRNNPETKARANDMTRQLTDAIEKLEDELAAAQKSGDKAAIAKAAEALDARRSWLKALGG